MNLVAQCDGCGVELDCKVGHHTSAAQLLKALGVLREAEWTVVELPHHNYFHFCPKCKHLAEAVENDNVS